MTLIALPSSVCCDTRRELYRLESIPCAFSHPVASLSVVRQPRLLSLLERVPRPSLSPRFDFSQVFSLRSALRCYSKPPVTSQGRGFLHTQTQSPCPVCGQDVSLRHQRFHAGGQFLATCVLRGCSKDGITPNCPHSVDFPTCPLTCKSSLGFCSPTPFFSWILRTAYETGVTRPRKQKM